MPMLTIRFINSILKNSLVNPIALKTLRFILSNITNMEPIANKDKKSQLSNHLSPKSIATTSFEVIASKNNKGVIENEKKEEVLISNAVISSFDSHLLIIGNKEVSNVRLHNCTGISFILFAWLKYPALVMVKNLPIICKYMFSYTVFTNEENAIPLPYFQCFFKRVILINDRGMNLFLTHKVIVWKTLYKTWLATNAHSPKPYNPKQIETKKAKKVEVTDVIAKTLNCSCL